MEKNTHLLPTLAVTLTLITIFMLNINPVWSSGKPFIKVWKGNTANVTDIVITNLNTSQIIYTSPVVPPSGQILLHVDHDTLLKITWKDWRGTRTETIKVQCIPGEPETLVNEIPYPKLGQTGGCFR